MVYHVTVLYLKKPESTFNMDYYLATHMPLVLDTWKSHGLTGYTVKQYETAPDGSEPVYMVGCDLFFGAKEELRKAMQDPGTKAVFDDVPNFTNETPLLMSGSQTGEVKV